MTILTDSIVENSPAAASTAASSKTIKGLGSYDTLRIEGTIQGGTGGTLDVYVQCSYDMGTTWSDLVHFAQKADGASASTYGVTLSTAQGDALAAVGKGTSPALAAGTARAGCWGDQLRLLFVAGDGTTAGAAQTVKVFAGRNSGS